MTPDWTTTVTYYKIPGSEKPYHLEIKVTSHLGDTKINLEARTFEDAIPVIESVIKSVYPILTAQAPIVLLGNGGKGVLLTEQEESLLLKALHGF